MEKYQRLHFSKIKWISGHSNETEFRLPSLIWIPIIIHSNNKLETKENFIFEHSGKEGNIIVKNENFKKELKSDDPLFEDVRSVAIIPERNDFVIQRIDKKVWIYGFETLEEKGKFIHVVYINNPREAIDTWKNFFLAINSRFTQNLETFAVILHKDGPYYLEGKEVKEQRIKYIDSKIKSSEDDLEVARENVKKIMTKIEELQKEKQALL